MPRVSQANRFVEAVQQDTNRVNGLTHDFYRYPARFSPVFVRTAIEAFSKPGDWVMDPFAGGGTTLVEAMALGRNALGIDISSLSSFVCKAKTTILTDRDIGELEKWREGLPEAINMFAPGKPSEVYAAAGYYRNLGGNGFWRLRKAIEQSLATVEDLQSERSAVLARCVVLRTAQWALDGQKAVPSVSDFRERLCRFAGAMIEGAWALRVKVESFGKGERPRARGLNRSVVGAHSDRRVKKAGVPKLIVTSPPYPGVHVLYHRWQVDGRKETPAPFWIAGEMDGEGASYYTMGCRKEPEHQTYFKSIRESFSSVAQIAGPDTTIVQMIAFSDAERQLPRYLDVMEQCGLREARPWDADSHDGRLWREVPNRKWYTQGKPSSSAQEVVLVHRKATRT